MPQALAHNAEVTEFLHQQQQKNADFKVLFLNCQGLGSQQERITYD